MLKQSLNKALSAIQQELYRESVYLLPLRLFIGIGWIRASLEKFSTIGWPQGAALAEFFQEELAGGHVVFPFYQRLITHLFTPNALALSWIIMIGQMLVGLAMLFGALTNFALLWGLFMNLNFILAGQVNPSAFYVVIQFALLAANTGGIFGLDHFLWRRLPLCFLTAQPERITVYSRLERVFFFLTALVALVIGVASIPYIQDFSPASVDDPATILLILSAITGLTALITALRHRGGAESYQSPQAEQSSLLLKVR